MKSKGFIFILILLWLSGACARVKVANPEGFAKITDKSYFKAVSPEGVVFKVHCEKNYPVKGLEFWGRALRNHLADEGYRFIKEDKFNAGSTPGILFEWGAPYGNEDYIYLTALLVRDRTIAIAEAAGEFTLYTGYRNALLESLASIEIH